jgi:outer membrane usher protein
VLHDGQPAGETDEQGRLLVVGLRPFEDNTLRLVQEDLPLTAIVPADSIVVRPYSRGVVEARFPVDAASSESIVLQLDAGGPVPAGARIILGAHVLPVGRDGLAQIPVLYRATEASVKWPGGECRAHLPVSRKLSVRRIAQCTSAK